MAKMTPGQVKITPYRDKTTGVVAFKLKYAPDVSEEAAHWLFRQLTEPRETLLTRLSPATNPPEAPFFSAWEERGYNLMSIKFSIYTLAANRRKPKKLRRLTQRPGVLFAKLGREEYDSTPDLICCWHWPVRRHDMRFFHSFFSMPTMGTGWAEHTTLWDELTSHGFDRNTFNFEIHHIAPWVWDPDWT